MNGSPLPELPVPVPKLKVSTFDLFFCIGNAVITWLSNQLHEYNHNSRSI
jgi:hypothetical protein